MTGKKYDSNVTGYGKDRSLIDTLKQYLAIGSAAAVFGASLGGCAARTPNYQDSAPVVVDRQIESISHEKPIEQRIDDLLTDHWAAMAGGFSRYDGHRNGDYLFTLVSPEADPPGRDQKFGWRYGQFDDFFNALGIGDEMKEDKDVADLLIRYMRDQGVKGQISGNTKSITVMREGDTMRHPLVQQAERGDYEGFIIVRNGNNSRVIEDILFASNDVGSSRFKGYVAQRNPDDNHSRNIGHVYWKTGDTVRIPDSYAGIMNFPTLEADLQREIVTQTVTRESKERKNWCLQSDENLVTCILGSLVIGGLIYWGVSSISDEDRSSKDPPNKSPPAGGGQDGGPGVGSK